ncbi:MAG: hypothetical protein ABI740_07775 [Alphaproteobacteria bacterium]
MRTALAPRPRLFPIQLRTIGGWLGQYDGKTLVGEMKGDRFKAVLLGNVGSGVRWSGGAVVIVGQIGDHEVHVELRPPLFALAFISAWVLVVTAALVLSFFGPSNTILVQTLLVAMGIVPLLIFSAFFAFEARQARRRLRDVFEAG